MRYIDLQMLFFVGGSLVQECWIYYRLPRVYYFPAPRNEDHRKNMAA
jgi:hypothetical protein